MGIQVFVVFYHYQHFCGKLLFFCQIDSQEWGGRVKDFPISWHSPEASSVL